jgi:hypothetical protein
LLLLVMLVVPLKKLPYLHTLTSSAAAAAAAAASVTGDTSALLWLHFTSACVLHCFCNAP